MLLQSKQISKCEPIFKTDFRKVYIKNQLSPDILKNKKILVIRPDRLWDLCVSFPFVFLLSQFAKKVDRWINRKYFVLAKKLIDIFNLPNVDIFIYNLENRDDFFWYTQEKHSKLLRFKLGIKFLFSRDFFWLIKFFKKYDIIFDLVGKRRFQLIMFLSKLLTPKIICGVDKTLTDKLLDTVLYRGDFENIIDQFIKFIDLNQDYLSELKKQFLNIQSSKNWDYILIHIGYWWEQSRNWWYENWKELIRWLTDKDFNIKIVYTTLEINEWKKLYDEFGNYSNVEFVENPSFEKFFYLVLNCSYFIGVDSGPFHLADILWKRGLVLFSRENEKIWGPRNPQIKVLKFFKWICLRRNCIYDYCIKLISVEKVISVLKEDLKFT